MFKLIIELRPEKESHWFRRQHLLALVYVLWQVILFYSKKAPIISLLAIFYVEKKSSPICWILRIDYILLKIWLFLTLWIYQHLKLICIHDNTCWLQMTCTRQPCVVRRMLSLHIINWNEFLRKIECIFFSLFPFSWSCDSSRRCWFRNNYRWQECSQKAFKNWFKLMD